MAETQPIQYRFGPYRLDLANQCLWKEEAMLNLTPKAFAVLQLLVENRARLVTKDELLESVWSDSFVGDGVLKVCVREIRKALADDAEQPRFIATVHRRGYRFVSPVEDVGPMAGVARQQLPVPGESQTKTEPPLALVGRDATLNKLWSWWQRATEGKRQIVFVTGDPGAGKTAVVDEFLRRLPGGTWIARGHCMEQYGGGEAYLPILEAFSELGRASADSNVVDLLATYAPTWLTQMPALAAQIRTDVLKRDVLGATRERMLREMAETIEALSATRPLVVVVEDLHWSDNSTLDLVSYLARRRAPARLLLIATYRPVEVILTAHPLKSAKQELQLHGLCQEVAVEFLSARSIRQYIDVRFPGNAFSEALADLINARTDGNPLSMVTSLNLLRSAGTLSEVDGQWRLSVPVEQLSIEIPENLRELIEKHIRLLDPEDQELLMAASVVGTEFSVAAAAAALDTETATAEDRLEALARRGIFIQRRGQVELPAGPVAQYAFTHSLYQNVLYDRVPPGRRLRLHLRVAEAGERAYGARAREIAAELAVHFEEARDYGRACVHLFQAAENASRRNALHEAVEYLRKAQVLCGRLPEDQRGSLPATSEELLGMANRASGRMPEALSCFERMEQEALQRHDPPTVMRALTYQASVLSWLDRDRCLSTAERALQVGRSLSDPLLRAHAEGYYSYWHLLYEEWRDEDAAASARAIEAARKAGHRELLSFHVCRHSYFLGLQSRYSESIDTASEGIQLSIEVGDVFDHSMAQFFRGWSLLHAGRWGELVALSTEVLDLVERNGHLQWARLFHLQLAWLHEQCGAYNEAKEIAEQVLDQNTLTGHTFTRLMGATILGHALTGLGEPDRAIGCFREILAWTHGSRVLMDWIWEMQIRLGMARCWMALGDTDKALGEAKRLETIATLPGERSYIAIAKALQAQAQRSERMATKALELLDGQSSLMAERMVLAAVRPWASARKSSRYTDRLREINASLAAQLQSAPDLREAVLTST